MENKDWVIISILVLIFLYWGIQQYGIYKENKEWVEYEVCDYWVAYDEFPCPGIILNFCERIETEHNTIIEKCQCTDTNETAYRACQIKHIVKEFKGNNLFWNKVITFEEDKEWTY